MNSISLSITENIKLYKGHAYTELTVHTVRGSCSLEWPERVVSLHRLLEHDNSFPLFHPFRRKRLHQRLSLSLPFLVLLL